MRWTGQEVKKMIMADSESLDLLQPFMRCQKQTGYVMKMERPEDFKNDGIFKRLYFKHSVNLSN